MYVQVSEVGRDEAKEIEYEEKEGRWRWEVRWRI
jgi:hypothetical protein